MGFKFIKLKQYINAILYIEFIYENILTVHIRFRNICLKKDVGFVQKFSGFEE